jgi:chloride channel protein, CIC family
MTSESDLRPPIWLFRLSLVAIFVGIVTGFGAISREFTIAHEEDIMFGDIGRMWQRGAMMVVVVRGNGKPSAADVLGVITKEHVADSVALSVRPFTAIDNKS